MGSRSLGYVHWISSQTGIFYREGGAHTAESVNTAQAINILKAICILCIGKLQLLHLANILYNSLQPQDFKTKQYKDNTDIMEQFLVKPLNFRLNHIHALYSCI